MLLVEFGVAVAGPARARQVGAVGFRLRILGRQNRVHFAMAVGAGLFAYCSMHARGDVVSRLGMTGSHFTLAALAA